MISNGIPKIRLSSIISISFVICVFCICLFVAPVFAQQEGTGGAQVGVAGFLDEDGDGFNDLLPDRDGDGVPDALDPDCRGPHADSIWMHNRMHDQGDSLGMMHRMMDGDHMGMHGEPGQYGPGDSTCHGGMHGGGMDGGGMHGGGGGMNGGGMDSTGMGGGMGGGKIEPGSNGSKAREVSIENPAKELPKTDNINLDKNDRSSSTEATKSRQDQQGRGGK